MTARLELSDTLHGAGREFLTTAATYGKELLDTLQTERRRDQPLIHQLADAIHLLMQGLNAGNADNTDRAAYLTREVLRDILKPSDLKKHFKDYGWTGMFFSWKTYLADLYSLERILDDYPHIDKEELQNTGTKAQKLVENELRKQQTWMQWTASKAMSYAAPIVKSAVPTIVNQVVEQTGLRQTLGTVAEQTGLSDVVETVIGKNPASDQRAILHPLLDLERLIATFETRPKDFLPASQGHQLGVALHKLDQKSPFFRGIEQFVLKAIGGCPLQNSLSKITETVTAFIKEKEIDHPIYFQMIYHFAVEEKLIPARMQVENPNEQAERGYRFIQELQCKTQLEGAIAIDMEYRKKEKVLRKAAAQFDRYDQLSQLADTLSRRQIKSLADLSEAVSLGLHFFKTHPETHLAPEVMKALTVNITSWLSFVFEWGENHLEPEPKAYLRDTLDGFVQRLNRGEFVQALQGLQRELESEPLSTEFGKIAESHEQVAEVSDTVQKLGKAYNQEELVPNWNKAIEHEREKLVENLKMWTTFNVIYNAVCQPNPARDKEGAPDTAVSNAAIYDNIMKKIDDLPEEKRSEAFKTMLHQSLDSRSDIGFFTRAFAKILIPFIFSAVGFFTKHFTKALVEYLTKTMHSPTDQPLGTTHLQLVKRVNDTMIAHKKAMARFGADTEGRELGAKSREDAISDALKASDLNHGYTHDELVKKTTELAINEFLQVRSSHPTLSSWQKKLQEFPINSSSKGAEWVKAAMAFFPQLGIDLLFLFYKIREGAKTFFFQWGAKRLLSHLDIVNKVLKTVTNSIYKQSRYTNMIDEVILQQLREVEKLLEQEGNASSAEESLHGKALFRELVDNLFTVIEMRQNRTSEEMARTDERGSNFLDAARRGIQEMADENLKEATVQLLIFVYQTILTENNVNFLLHKTLQKTNSSLRPYNRIQEVFSDQEKIEIAQGIGKHFENLTDTDLRLEFAKRANLSADEVTDTMIDDTLRKKYADTEHEIGITLNRIIKKSVHQVVQKSEKQHLMTSEEAIFEYINWIEGNFFPPGTALEATEQNLPSRIRKKIAAIRSAPDKTRPELVRELHREFSSFMHELEQKLNGMKAKEKDRASSDAHIRTLYEITGQALLPDLNLIAHHTLGLVATEDLSELDEIERHLTLIEQTLEAKRIHFDAIRSGIREREANLGDRIRKAGGAIVRGAAPPLLDQVEQYVQRRLGTMATEGMLMYKDASMLEAVIRHGVLLNFVESLGHER